MKMFKKAVPAPKTVDEALAGFAALKQQLADVIGLNIVRRDTGHKRIADAQTYAAQVEADETNAILAAEAEIKRAEAAEVMIRKLLGEEVAVEAVTA